MDLTVRFPDREDKPVEDLGESRAQVVIRNGQNSFMVITRRRLSVVSERRLLKFSGRERQFALGILTQDVEGVAFRPVHAAIRRTPRPHFTGTRYARVYQYVDIDGKRIAVFLSYVVSFLANGASCVL